MPALRRGLAELAALGDTGDAGLVAVLAADLPFLRAAHLRALLAAAAGQDGAVLTDDDGRPQWLAGCWRAAVLRRAAGRYPGASLHGLLSPLNPVSVRIEPEPGEPPPWLDCDTEADVRRARDWVSGALGRAVGDDDVAQQLAGHEAVHLLADEPRRLRVERRGAAGHVRGDDHARAVHQRMIGRQRLRVGHVQGGPQPALFAWAIIAPVCRTGPRPTLTTRRRRAAGPAAALAQPAGFLGQRRQQDHDIGGR